MLLYVTINIFYNFFQVGSACLLKSKTKSGIHLPQNDQKIQQKGTVIAVGPGRMLDNGAIHPVTLKEGDRVLLPYGKMKPFQEDGEEYEVFTEGEIFGVIQK